MIHASLVKHLTLISHLMDLGVGWGLKDCPVALACLCESGCLYQCCLKTRLIRSSVTLWLIFSRSAVFSKISDLEVQVRFKAVNFRL